MIASVAFRRFKALRNTQLELAPFNLVVGPNGSGKTSLIQAVLQLRTLARLPVTDAPIEGESRAPEVTFAFVAPWRAHNALMACTRESMCEALRLQPGSVPADGDHWAEASQRLQSIRAYLLDHYAMAQPSPRGERALLNSNGANLAAVLGSWRDQLPEVFAAYCAEALQLFNEYDALRVEAVGETMELALRLRDEGEWIPAEGLSQGTLYGLALCAIAHEPSPPAIVCIEELDRGLHPRLLREVRDVMYRLSYPSDHGLARAAVQVIATTHSPYLLDLFRDHPEEVVIAEKQGRSATFARLSDRSDLAELIAEGSLGDLWYSGLLGGVPDES